MLPHGDFVVYYYEKGLFQPRSIIIDSSSYSLNNNELLLMSERINNRSYSHCGEFTMVNTYLKCIPAAILIICFLVVFVKETIHRQLSSQINKNSAETETSDFLTGNLDVSKRKLQFENMFDSVGIAGGVGGSKKRRGSRGGSGGRQRRVAPVPVLQNSAASKLKISAEGKSHTNRLYLSSLSSLFCIRSFCQSLPHTI